MFSLINRVYRLNKLCFSIWKTMFLRNSAFHSINWVFRDKLCFSSEKKCFSLEKHCLSAINSVFRFITHLACHTSQPLACLLRGVNPIQLSSNKPLRIGDCCWQVETNNRFVPGMQARCTRLAVITRTKCCTTTVGQKIIKWTVCTKWVHPKIMTHSVRHIQ